MSSDLDSDDVIASQCCPEYQALLDMTQDLCKTLPMKDLIPSFITLRILDVSHIEDLRKAEGNLRVVEKFLLNHLYPDLLLSETDRFYRFITAMKNSSKCEFLVTRLEERIKYHQLLASSTRSTPHSVNQSATIASDIDFSDCDIFQGFMLLVAELPKSLKSANFSAIKRAFKAKIHGGVQLPDDLKLKIEKAKLLDDLLDALVESKYWNFADLRLLDVLVFSSGKREAKELVDKYKKTFFNIKLIDILNICSHTVSPVNQLKEYMCRVGSKINKEPDKITVADLAKYCTALETVIMDIIEGSCVLEHIEKGCVKMYFLIPLHFRHHAYKSALSNRHKFHSLHLQYLKIESYPVIYDQFTIQPMVLSTLLCLPYPIAATHAEIIDYYYCFLAINLSNGILCQVMFSLKLVKEEDDVTLSMAPSEYQRNTLLLDHLLVSDATSIQGLCYALQDTKHYQDIGIMLVNAIQSKKDMGSNLQSERGSLEQEYLADGIELPSKIIVAAKTIHIKFLYFIIQIKKILQKCDKQVFLEACNKLYAYYSQSKVESLLPSDIFSSIDTTEVILNRLSFLWSWHNCSVIRTLLEACNCKDGLTLLDEFESQIDLNQPIELFPIPRLSSKMTPSSSSSYTVLSIRSELYQDQKAPLRYTREIAAILKKTFGISEHALQLLAVELTPLTMYWMIPKSIVTFISREIHKYADILRYTGLLEISAYPSVILFPEVNWSLRSFGMLCNDPREDLFLYIASMEDESKVHAKYEQEKIASLQSELLIKSQELDKLKNEKKELTAKYSLSKVKMGKMKRQLSGDIELLASSRSELTNKVKELERRISIDNETLIDLESELKVKSLELESFKHEKTMLYTSYEDTPDHRAAELQSSSDYPPTFEPALDYSTPGHTDLLQKSNASFTEQESPSGHITVMSNDTEDSYQESTGTTHPLSPSDEQPQAVSVHSDMLDSPRQPLLEKQYSTLSSSTTRSRSNSTRSRYGDPPRTEKKCSAFLIGANITGVSVPENAAVCRKPSDKSSKNSLDGVLMDLRWMNIFMNDRSISVYEVMLGNRQVKLAKRDILGAFKNFFSQKDMRRFVIYYSGHGSNGKCNTSKGDWCFETSGESGPKIIYIGLKDILELWDEMRFQCIADSCELEDHYLLFIIADSCFSGSWVEEIKAKRPYKVTPRGEKYRDVHMIASCRSNEICYYNVSNGGDFTSRYITADSSRHNLRVTAAHVAKVAGQGVIQGVTFPLYMPIKGLSNYINVTSHKHTPVATNEKQKYRVLLMKYNGEILPIGRGLGIASGWSWMLSGQIFHS